MTRSTASRKPPAKKPRAVSRPHDPAETQADKAADVVARGGSVTGWSFGSVPVDAGVHREDKGKPADDEKVKDAAKKTGEAVLETEAGKKLQEKVKETPLVKKAGEFLATTPGKVVAGGAIAAGVGGLAAAKQPLPIQAPEIPLDKVTPGLSAKVTVEGPVNSPTFVGLSLTYKEQVKGNKAGPTEKEKIAADTARLKAQAELFKPQEQKDQEKADEQAAIARYVASQQKLFGSSTLLPLKPADKPKTIDVPEQEPSEPKKEKDETPVQREPATTAEHDAASVDTSGVDRAVRGGGRALDEATRRSMEARFGYDFSGVRIHDDGSARSAASDVAATAFTVGDDIVFGDTGYDPSTPQGRHLLAHELAHVIQQRAASAHGGSERLHWRSIFGPTRSQRPEESFDHDESAQWSFGSVPMHALDTWRPGQHVSPRVRGIADRAGSPVPQDLLAELPVDPVVSAEARVHNDHEAAQSATQLGAAAFAMGHHIAIRPDFYPPRSEADRGLLAHELGHVAQARRSGSDLTMRDDDAAERSANESGSDRLSAPGVRRHPITKIGKWTVKKLAKKGGKKFISKHIAKHMRAIASKSIHSVFLRPRAVRGMVSKTVEEAVKLGERRAGAAAGTLLEEGALKVAHQATGTLGKFRLVIQKEFANAIGTKGQKVLQIVLDQTGRIVTAFPRDGFKVIGLSAVGIDVLTAKSADAAEQIRSSVEREQALREASANASQDEDSWVDWIPFIGDVFGGSLNAGEDEGLKADRLRDAREALVARTTSEIVRGVEEDLQRSLGPEEVADLQEQVLMILVSGIDLDADAEQEDTP